MSNNTELARQRLELALRKLELFIAQNDLKPTLDLAALYRMNGIGEQLDDAIRQLSTAEFFDWEVGFAFSVPLGFREAKARTSAAEQRLIRDQRLLQQAAVTVSYELSNELLRLEFAFRQMSEITEQLKAADIWLEGARLRYRNSNPDDDSDTGLLEVLNEYLRALRFRTDSAIEQATLTAEYNSAVVRLEELKGTLLSFFAITFPGDPCNQLARLPDSTKPQIDPWLLPLEFSDQRIREAPAARPEPIQSQVPDKDPDPAEHYPLEDSNSVESDGSN